MDDQAPKTLETEWQRIGLLAHCLAESRQGRDINSETLEQLRDLQQRVDQERHNHGAWQRLCPEPLSGLEQDLLACIVAPEAEPHIGWIYRNIQGTSSPYPSGALLRELLALGAEETQQLHHVLDKAAPLRRHRLIRAEEDGPYHPLFPGEGVTARVLGLPVRLPTPPGAQRVNGTASWDDLILPKAPEAMLREFLDQVQLRSIVFDKWGARERGGPIALFSGPSGTGKTLAATVLATELKWPLFRVDLGTLVSKYIGETEKNINRLFDAAHDQPMVLQFDEADSLFGKRGEIKEARDRYANMEVSHLLARVENHRGPCILTTNLRGHLDKAFARRFQLVVDFPRPGAGARARLWDRLLPPAAPREPDLDPDFLGKAANLTGGEIRNAALQAAFFAARAEKPIGLPHVALAVWRELGKDGRERELRDLGPLQPYYPEQGYLC
ncbi:MAG: ATP-binding protein [Acidobacteriota bacterium]|nr:ATP-binding protein [Acidobacteriota bacterium]